MKTDAQYVLATAGPKPEKKPWKPPTSNSLRKTINKLLKCFQFLSVLNISNYFFADSLLLQINPYYDVRHLKIYQNSQMNFKSYESSEKNIHFFYLRRLFFYFLS
jgi:hypothetical protein